MKKMQWICAAGTLAAASALAQVPGTAPAPKPPGTPQAPTTASTRIKLSPQVTLQSLRSAPPTAMVETKRGRTVSAAHVVAIADAIRAANAKPRAASPSGFAKPSGAASVVLRPGSHLPSVLARPASDVVQLPNGTKMTVGDLNRVASVMQRMGRGSVASLPSSRASVNGPATRVASARDLEALKDKPDSTILENRNGVRVTLGELRGAAKRPGAR